MTTNQHYSSQKGEKKKEELSCKGDIKKSTFEKKHENTGEQSLLHGRENKKRQKQVVLRASSAGRKKETF
jgi:hypothetical protein